MGLGGKVENNDEIEEAAKQPQPAPVSYLTVARRDQNNTELRQEDIEKVNLFNEKMGSE